MLKRNMKLLTTLAIGLSLTLGAVTVNAAGTSTTPKSNGKQKIEHKMGNNKENKNSIYSILKSSLGLTDAQIKDAAKAGKTAFDLAKEKNITADQLKTMIIDAQSKSIDAAVTSGKLTQDKATTMKANLTTKIKNWDGSLKHEGQEKGKMKGNFNPANSILKNNLGFTEAQIKDAAKAGKTAFDLAKEKNITADQLKTMIIDAQSKSIDAAVTSGKLTQDKATTMKANLTTKIKNWDGSLKHEGQEKGKMKGNFNPANSTLKQSK